MAVATETASASALNIADRLSQTAATMPEAAAVIEPGRQRGWRRDYRRYTFRQLDDDSSAIARALVDRGAGLGTRLVLMVRPSFDFVSLVFAIFKSGATAVLIDPGMGVKSMLRCLDDVRPDGFVAISPAQAVRVLSGSRYRDARINVTVGRRWFWGGATLRELREEIHHATLPATAADDAAAIIFTSGSTGPAKGVLYSHRNFAAQVDQIRERFDIRPGAVDLACFPLFGLFNSAMGVTTVIPEMDASRPARVDPGTIVQTIGAWRVTQSFASPAVWDRVSRYCEKHALKLPSLRQVFSAGAPVSNDILRRMRTCLSAACELHTPYGATEALPVAAIDARTVLDETSRATDQGAGTCVGRRFAGLDWKVVRIVDGPIPTLAHAQELPPGEIGEIIVRGPQVTTRYVTRVEANALAKIADGETFWHRLGDVGYLDDQQRFWFCGRLSQRVVTAAGTMFTEPCECVIRTHPSVCRAALVGVGERGNQTPAVVVQPREGAWPTTDAERSSFISELRALAREHAVTGPIESFLLHQSLPVDPRHNSKIVREELSRWAEGQLQMGGRT